MKLKGKILPQNIARAMEQVAGAFAGASGGEFVEMKIAKVGDEMCLSLQGDSQKMEIVSDWVGVESSGEGTFVFSWPDFKSMMTWPRGKNQVLEWSIKEKPGTKIFIMEIIRGKARLEAESVEETMHTMEKMTPIATMLVDSKAFSSSLRKCNTMSARDDVRYYLNGVFIQVTAGSEYIDVVGTDGHRMGHVQIKPDEIRGEPSGVIIPNEGVSQLELFMNKYATDKVAIGFAESCLIVKGTHGYRLRCRLIDGRYPDWQRIFPDSQSGLTITVDKEDFMDGLSASSKTFSGLGYPLAELSYHTDRIDLKGHVHKTANTTIRSTEYTIDASGFEGESFTAYLNIKYVNDVLTNIATESVRMNVSSPAGPTMFVGDSERYIVMPTKP